MFFDFEGLDFGAERVDFSVVFSKALWRGTFFNFGSNSGPNGRPNESQKMPKGVKSPQSGGQNRGDAEPEDQGPKREGAN